MMNKKGLAMAPLLLLGVIMGTAAYFYYSSLYNPPQQSALGEEALNQIVERDLEINRIRYYLEEGGRVSLANSLYHLAHDGLEDSRCGLHLGIPVYQTRTKNLDECMPDISSDLHTLFGNYFTPYLSKHSVPNNYDFKVSLGESLLLEAEARQKIVVPRFDSDYLIEYENKPFDSYEITLYAQVECDELINDEYSVRIHDRYTTQGVKYLHADVRVPPKGASALPGGEELIYHSLFQEHNENALISYPFIGGDYGEYCMPLGFNEIYNLGLKTFKGNDEQCSVKTARDNSLWMGSGNFGGYDIQTWNKYEDRNEDGKKDKDCSESPTYLECPGIRVSYCGKTGWRSFPVRNAEFPGWSAVKSGDSDIDATFVWVWYGDEPEGERPFGSYLRAKTAAKFLVDISPDYTQTGTAVKRDSWVKKFLTDQLPPPPVPLAQRDTGVSAPTYVHKWFSPSFATSLEYDGSDYSAIESFISEITDTCHADSDGLGCVRSFTEKKEGFLLISNPRESEQVFFHVYQRFWEILNEAETVSLEIDFVVSDSYDFTVRSEGGGIVVTMGGGFEKRLETDIQLSDIDFSLSSAGVKIKDTLLNNPVLKKGTNGITLEESDRLEAPINRYFAFTYTSDKRFFPHSEPITYRFALFLSDHAPGPIDVLAEEKWGEDKSVLLSWKKPQELDVDSFRIYTDVFVGQSIDGLSFIETSDVEQVTFISKECHYTSLNSGCLHEYLPVGFGDEVPAEIYRRKMDAHQLYLDSDGHYYYTVDSLEDREYSFAVVAVDSGGNAIEEIAYSDSITPRDRLAPSPVGFFVENNEVIIEDNPSLTYFYFMQSENCDGILSDDLSINRVDLEGISLNLVEGGNYCIAVIASDHSGNPLEVISDGSVNTLEVKPEYSIIFDEMATSQIVSQQQNI